MSFLERLCTKHIRRGWGLSPQRQSTERARSWPNRRRWSSWSDLYIRLALRSSRSLNSLNFDSFIESWRYIGSFHWIGAGSLTATRVFRMRAEQLMLMLTWREEPGSFLEHMTSRYSGGSENIRPSAPEIILKAMISHRLNSSSGWNLSDSIRQQHFRGDMRG